MATNAKLWGTGGSAATDVNKSNCGILTGYPSVLTAPSNYLVRSATASPAPQEMVSLSATPTDSKHITFSSSGSDLLGTKILSFFIYSNRPQYSGTDPYVIYLRADAVTDSYLVSSTNPVVTTSSNTGMYLYWGRAYTGSDISMYAVGTSKNTISLSYSGTNGNLTITISSSGILDTNATYTGIFRVVDES